MAMETIEVIHTSEVSGASKFISSDIAVSAPWRWRR